MNEHHATLPGALEFNDGTPLISSKEKVLAVWPDAYCQYGTTRFEILAESFYQKRQAIGWGQSEVAAWDDAASHLK